MKRLHSLLAAFTLTFGLLMPMHVVAQTDDSRLDGMDRRISRVEQRVEQRAAEDGAAGLAVFVCAAFCALWAQQTKRNAWLWFFLGLFFNVFTLLVLLRENSNDKKPEA